MNSKPFRERPTLVEVYPGSMLPESCDSDGERFSKTSVRDQAALLLSIADIAKSEIKTCPSALSDEQDSFPKFPFLGDNRSKCLTPHHNDSLRELLTPYPSGRIRAVSMDTPEGDRRTPSPLLSPPALVTVAPVTPISGRLSHRSLRLSAKARQERVMHEREDIIQVTPILKRSKGKPLQGEVPEDVTVKKIFRRKFSWKNYPEVRTIGSESFSNHD